jgi:hypothetical protein
LALIEAVERAARENLYDPTRIPPDWTPLSTDIDPGEPSWERDRELAAAVNARLRMLASHIHLHGPDEARAEPGDMVLPWVTTNAGVSVLHPVPGGDGRTIVPGEIVFGYANAGDARRRLEGITARASPATQRVGHSRRPR